ncbi:virB8 family protein [Thauera mechernichensis]|uniref:VirB8 family protein n=1 Tax=Thauera mechernichensis TaxID=82788 RepID=A0ABW3WK87_9RHOO|nr:virB8 family protein [Thauera mechernichensis]MDG3066891.1 virB8 family protein [Thauera mechernichensis]
MSKKVEKQDFENYLKEARTWETDKVREIEKSRKAAWWVAIGSGVTAIASVFAVSAMMPLKTVEPYVIRVDNSTGIVDVVEALTDGKTNYDEAMNKYFVQWYVRYREGYSKELAEDYYYNVGLMSSTTEQQKYFQFFNPKNPLSPLAVYGDYAKVKIGIKSTSFINPTVALVRYTKEIERGLDKPIITHWAATVTFRYTKAPMAEKDRGINPLGFQVVEYRNDPDALAPAATPVAAVAPVASAPAPSVTVFPTTEARPAVPAIQQ